MKIEKIDNDNIKEYTKDLGIDATYEDEKSIINVDTFGVREEDKFLFSFTSLPEEDLISITFGKKKVDSDVVKRCINFLNNSLSFNGHLVVQTSDKKLMEIMDDLYRVKLIFVTKKVKNCEEGKFTLKEKYAP